MIDFFRTLFRPAPPSSTTAKERLRLVLLSDHLSLAPDVVEALKRDLLAVISRYVEIDSDHADVTFEHREREVAMLASIPITGVRARRQVATIEATPPAPTPTPTPTPAAPVALEAPPVEPVAEPEPETVASAPDTRATANATSANAARPRRRRRKKAIALTKPAAQA